MFIFNELTSPFLYAYRALAVSVQLFLLVDRTFLHACVYLSIDIYPCCSLHLDIESFARSDTLYMLIHLMCV